MQGRQQGALHNAARAGRNRVIDPALLRRHRLIRRDEWYARHFILLLRRSSLE
jgi:hypothetical protein